MYIFSNDRRCPARARARVVNAGNFTARRRTVFFFFFSPEAPQLAARFTLERERSVHGSEDEITSRDNDERGDYAQ